MTIGDLENAGVRQRAGVEGGLWVTTGFPDPAPPATVPRPRTRLPGDIMRTPAAHRLAAGLFLGTLLVTSPACSRTSRSARHAGGPGEEGRPLTEAERATLAKTLKRQAE